MREEYRRFFAEAEASPEYWAEVTIDEFTRELSRRMKELGVSRAELARRVGTVPAHITKLLGGNANFTVLTMTKLALALGAVVHLQLREPEVTPRQLGDVDRVSPVMVGTRRPVPGHVTSEVPEGAAADHSFRMAVEHG